MTRLHGDGIAAGPAVTVAASGCSLAKACISEKTSFIIQNMEDIMTSIKRANTTPA